MRVAVPRAVSLWAAAALGAVLMAGAPGTPIVSGEAAAQRAAAPAAGPVPRPIAGRPTAAAAWTARVVVPVHPRVAPRSSARRMALLNGIAPYNGNPETLLVVGATSTRRDGVWYQVLLNNRPNTARGWVPAAAVRVTRTPFRVVVQLSRREVLVLRAGRPVARFRAAVGTNVNPTPTGTFAISEIVRQSRPGGFFGPFIITLTAHSERLNDFDGGDGRVAFHGTNRPGLLGQAVSAGCIRLSNRDVVRLARMVPAGAPVTITDR